MWRLLDSLSSTRVMTAAAAYVCGIFGAMVCASVFILTDILEIQISIL